MQVLKDIKVTRRTISETKEKRQSVGLVPTMGALHPGHLSLIQQSLKDNDITIVSIFVNPIQFNNAEDFAKYPSTLDPDLKLLESTGCHYVFLPEASEMYPQEPAITFNFGHLDTIMEGAHRPGHFSGVAVVVLKLFNIITPTRAYFGQKDIQQYKIIETVVKDLSLDVALVRMPIIREESGLALSSRNQRLSDEGKAIAAEIYKALISVREQVLNGEAATQSLSDALDQINHFPGLTLEYLELVKEEDLKPPLSYTDFNPLVLCFAGYVEGVRLIDNIIIDKGSK